MMRSLFSGVSGLKNHQTRMDVIGNNISNVNTTGFKSSRATFTDMLSQTMTGAASPSDNRGGTNPKQIGLGSSVSSIDLIFTNGSVQSTGKNTDLCISGNGLFAVKDNSGIYYTRDGAFEFDADGNYVLPGSGLYVQGWMASADGSLSTTGETTNIVVPAGKSMTSETTKTATYSYNLNAAPVSYKIAQVTVTYADNTTETTSAYDPAKVEGAVIKVTMDDGNTYALDASLAGTFELGQTLTDQVVYTTTVKSATASSTGTLKLTLDNTAYKAIDPDPPEIDGLTEGTYSVGGYYSPTPQTITAAVADNVTKTIELTLDNPDGKGFNKVTVPMPKDTETYVVGGTFQARLPIKSIHAATGAEIALADGTTETLTADLDITSANQDYDKKISGTITGLERDATSTIYTYNGKEVASVSLNTSDGSVLDGQIGQVYNAGSAFYPPSVTTVTVYDSLGGSHDIPVIFTKSAEKENTWSLSLPGGGNSYSYTESDGTTTNVTLDSSELRFSESGTYVDGSGSLSLQYGNGAFEQMVSLSLSDLTQYVGSSTINAHADGHAAGTLSSVSIDSSGIITGTYTNGVRQAEAQVAIAQFNNPSGLTKTGDSLYQESNNSGTANIKTAADLGVTITPAALEMSNVDIANEFTDMIITQRGFQGNSKIITVSDEMLETLINLKR